MSQSKVLKLAYKNNGTITSAMITEEKISRGHLHYLVKIGKLEHTARAYTYYLKSGMMSS